MGRSIPENPGEFYRPVHEWILTYAENNLEKTKIEFGFDARGNIVLADEISPDSCRLWDEKTSQKLDKDVFRRDLGNLVEVYSDVASRLGIKIN